ncbi:2-oxoglutarate dehydrogenase complex dihydrolipoyllysine-residue succinyltransferase [Metabacillus malikii]|uniref:Dihydrolipoyllysine-residue succinyltransferase component of 2-oxoglutarate dehydrogenase complex n=1 Tax=Metabacillus malikii TaxID=1504265 RepID=A0ABT9ZBE1_9BACI|nr:2-oxoglutarate dehydrogenase complex dihydrolipoyllysine-residue succinyltransferase [Metabacillus malikii]MDQ0228918.1 2-oxoglutarate dehydrogenase E2 component (dihydrolipoamide succinyltransferase) [Metabacillus malikii]
MVEIKVPELAESITEGTIAQWLKQPGELVEKGEYLLEVETDKVNVELTAEYTGVLKEVHKESGDTVQVGETIGVIDINSHSAEPATKSEEKIEEAVQADSKNVEVEDNNKQRPIASPAARKLARERGIDLQQVKTVDPLGRVRKQDVEAHSEGSVQPNEQQKSVAKNTEKQEAFKEQPGKPIERIKMSRRRQTIANRLVEVQQTAAMLTTFNEVDMTAVMEVRKRRKDKFFETHDVRLGFMSFFTKAVVAALKQYPLLNAEIHGNEIVMKKYYDIGIAVSAPEGLVVPVVRDADRLNFAGIESEILNLAVKARDNKLGLSDLQGGTFTITNGGVFGSLMSTPILNGPQVGILGMHKIQLRPVAIDEEKIENRPMMYIALSYDHRIVDGKEAVSFLATVKELLEDPESLLLEG